ncbi:MULTISPECIES: MOSC domain-containing protein [Pseudomonas]|uniref:MOSC domain-containing protein n=1 Tax=Pseudomonas putida TaxID=303 RepID=A0AAD0PE66_PSEPU|nr:MULTISPECIES: MOSC domain-containing protein [Pseudomonas]ANC02658.1 molybdenum cofactor sulfurase [Pseudomonas putida]AXA24335.1 MOSC domain-containing protein [Pseudomonas putida]KAB5627046.1 MOSC domain-containing protein [Pseudomonas putida]MBK0059365.1 MOSC domain-containing protein [Pseudomonas sp. S44]HEK1767948.1 MOSC domain-containing protein [Pseudomonas putida]
MFLSALYRYPVKSCQAQSLGESTVDAMGLSGDRRWMVVEQDTGRFLTQRAWPQLGRLTATGGDEESLLLQTPGQAPLTVKVPGADDDLRGVTIWRDTLRVPDAGDEAAAWLSQMLGKAVRLVHCPQQRARYLPSGYGLNSDRAAFPDGFPLLLIGQGSLDELNRRIGRPMQMLRFRPNLVVEGAEAFAEDGWKRIRIGDLTLRVLKPSVRCILTTLDPQTGERSSDREPLTTLKTFREREGDVLFGQNLAVDGSGRLEVGMPVEVLE